MIAAVFGLSGLTLTDEERDFFRDAKPAGYILFGRNVESPRQLRALTDELRSLHGRDDLPILVDQEGGRVARLRGSHWPEYPAGDAFSQLYDIAPASAIEAVRLNAFAMAHDLYEAGISVNCTPLLDVRNAETTPAIGDRALGYDAKRVAALGRAILDGMSGAGVAGIIKHIPGHGRAIVDSHKELPRVAANADELGEDIAPFCTLNEAPMAMSAHIVYEAWDGERPATMSPIVINDIIREKIGFDGLLFSDDLDMKALQGSADELALGCVEAGCDIALNCWARMDEMIAIARAMPVMSETTRARYDRACAAIALARANAANLGAEQGQAIMLAKRDKLFDAAHLDSNGGNIGDIANA